MVSVYEYPQLPFSFLSPLWHQLFIRKLINFVYILKIILKPAKLCSAFYNWCGKKGGNLILLGLLSLLLSLSPFFPFDSKQQILISFISTIQSYICNLCSHFYKVKLSERNWVIIQSLSEQNKCELSNIRKND